MVWIKHLLASVALVSAIPAAASSLPATTDFSVMSYNVHGLPWPIAKRRPQALRAIGERLADMRREGDQPHVVLLQEAFTEVAQQIGQEAGYRFVVTGPGRHDRIAGSADGQELRFARSDNPLKGEGDGKLENSGLLVLSDYPILDVKRVPYESLTCAGFDCLANKGMVLVRIAVPGAAQPITIVDTHMNSRGASGVANRRSDTAYGWQANQLRAFVSDNVPADGPAIVAGDFNIGRVPYREAMITGGSGILTGSSDALRTALAENLQSPDRAAAQAIVTHGKDWMFARGGRFTPLHLESVAVPFGREPGGGSLSDHFGYVAHYLIG